MFSIGQYSVVVVAVAFPTLWLVSLFLWVIIQTGIGHPNGAKDLVRFLFNDALPNN